MSDQRFQLATNVTSVIVGCLLVTFGGSLLWEHADLPLKTWRGAQKEATQRVQHRLDRAQREVEFELDSLQSDVQQKMKRMGPIQFGPSFTPGRGFPSVNELPSNMPISNRATSPTPSVSPPSRPPR